MFGKPRDRWLDDVEIVLNKMGVRGWRKTAKDRAAWKLILKEARVVHGPQSQCSRGETEITQMA